MDGLLSLPTVPAQPRARRLPPWLIEDLPENLQSVVTEHTIHRDYCPKCKKHVEPVVPDALPNATFGHRLISFTSWCHYGLGVTLDQLIDILQFRLRMKLSAGGDPAEEQPVESVGPRGADAGGADEHLPHAASPRPRPAADPRGGPSKPTCKPATSRHYPPQPLPASELLQVAGIPAPGTVRRITNDHRHG